MTTATAAALVLTLVAWLAPASPAQGPRVDELLSGRTAQGHDPIRAEDLLADIAFLASDGLEGRNTGSVGERLAAGHIIGRLSALPHIVPAGEEGFFQVFPAVAMAPGKPAPPPGRNVIAMLPGSDPALAHEVIVLGAHYDHVGRGEHGNSLEADELGGSLSNLVDDLHNGADDNASGSAALLELAASLATAPERPRRTIMFQWYSGEELGLLGSRWWVAHPTAVPLDDVVAMLNLDMVGRLTGSTLMVGGVGTSPTFPELVEQAAAREDLVVLAERSGAAPSDNSSFLQADKPVLFFFTGLHDDYHRPSDEVERVNAVGAARVARMVEDVLRSLDAEDAAPVFTNAPGESKLYRPSVFTGLNFADARPWMLGCAVVSIVIPDSPAALAGAREGDVVFRVDGERPTDRAALEALLRTIDPARTPREIEVWRALPGETPDEDSDWLESYERLTLSVRPVMR